MSAFGYTVGTFRIVQSATPEGGLGDTVALAMLTELGSTVEHLEPEMARTLACALLAEAADARGDVPDHMQRVIAIILELLKIPPGSATEILISADLLEHNAVMVRHGRRDGPDAAWHDHPIPSTRPSEG